MAKKKADEDLTPDEAVLALFEAWHKDPRAFLRCLQVRDPDGMLVPFDLWPEQETLVQQYMLARGNQQHLAVLKSRQIGSSTLWAGLLFWEWFMSIGGDAYALYLHKQDAGRKFVQQWAAMYDSLPSWLRKLRPLSSRTADRLVMDDTGASLERATAGGKGGARSGTYKVVIASEWPFWNDPEEVRATILGSMPRGLLVIESTANVFGDPLHTLFNQTDDRYRRVFLPWFKHEQYRESPREGWVPSAADADYALMHDLDLAQLYWRERKRTEIGAAKFAREFPSTLEEAYSVEGDVYLTAHDLLSVSRQPAAVEGWTRLPCDRPLDKPPAFVIGADAAQGVGRDFSVLYVVDAWTRQPVSVWRGNKTPPKEFAALIQETAAKYHDAKVLVESNTPGDVVLAHLRNLGGVRLWVDDKGKDWLTTSKSKAALFDALKSDLLASTILTVDSVLYRELRSITVTKTGTLDFPYLDSGHCDGAMSFALANYCARNLVMPQPVNRLQEARRHHKAVKAHGTRAY